MGLPSNEVRKSQVLERRDMDRKGLAWPHLADAAGSACRIRARCSVESPVGTEKEAGQQEMHNREMD